MWGCCRKKPNTHTSVILDGKLKCCSAGTFKIVNLVVQYADGGIDVLALFGIRRYSAVTNKTDRPVSVYAASWWSWEPVTTAAQCGRLPASADLAVPTTATTSTLGQHEQ